MVLNARRIEFRSFEDMAGHLNVWAAVSLTTPEQWNDVLVASRQWLEYSGRNQLLLASYGQVEGPVAGAETWRLVPSSTEGRMCAVRAGEHGWPVRVPITTGGSEPDPYLGGSRPTRAAVEQWEWRPVFSTGQLARRPAPGVLVPVDVPKSLTGANGEEAWLDVARKVARTTVRGRLPKTDDPHTVLAEAAGRVTLRKNRPPLEPALCDQVAWLVEDRVGRSSGQLSAFDPEPLEPRDRWPLLQRVLEGSRKLTGAVGVVAGVDLTGSPLPKMEVVDDRVVPAGRRPGLPPASFHQLPVGRWVEVGPYTAEEWAARGEQGAGRGAYLRLNRSAYLVAVEQGVEASWRLVDGAERTGHGLLATGTAPDLASARGDAVAAVQDRYPALQEPGQGASGQLRLDSGPDTVGRAGGWEPVVGEGNSAASQRQLNERVTVFAFPGPGGRWMPAVLDGTNLSRLPNVRTQDEAREVAERAGRQATRRAALGVPASLDQVVTDLATSADYSRATLAELTAPAADRPPLASDEVGPKELAEQLLTAGCTPATTVLVLRAEEVSAADTARLLPSMGVPMDDSIRVLHAHWNLPRVQAAQMLGAAAADMRAAGCSAEEILAARPREVLRTVPAEPDLWETAAATMHQAGHPPDRVVSHLVTHAPTAHTFAVGLTAVVPDQAEGMALAIRYGAQGDHLAAASERYGLDPQSTAQLLGEAGASPHVAVEALYMRCDRNPELTAQTASHVPGLDRTSVLKQLTTQPPADDLLVPPDATAPVGVPAAPSPDPTDPSSLLAHLPEGSSTPGQDANSLLAALPEPTPAETPDLAGGEP